MKSSVKGLHTRIDDLVERLYSLEAGGMSKKRSYSPLDKRNPHNHSLESGAAAIRQNAELETRILHLEDKLNSLAFNKAMGHNTSTQRSVHQASTSSLAQAKSDNLNDFAIEVDKALKDMEDRLLQVIAQKSEENRYDSRQMEMNIQDLNRKIASANGFSSNPRESQASFA